MIRSIKISNFKSIAELTGLKLGNNTYIVGKNGAGKSTLISAIYLTKKLAGKEDLDEVLTRIAPFGSEVFTRGSRQSSSHFELNIKTFKGVSYLFSYSFNYSPFEAAFQIIDESLTRLDTTNNVDATIYERVNDEIRAYDKKTGETEILPLSVKRSELVLANYNDEEVNEVTKTIAMFKILWFDRQEELNSFKVHSADRLDSSSLDAIVVSLFLSNRKSFEKAVHIIQQLIPEFEAPVVREIGPNGEDSKDGKTKISNRYIVFWREKESPNFQYTLTGLSDGNYRIIQLIFALYSSSGSTCLIGEEIENGQHFGRLKTLLEVLRVLSVRLNVQLIFTTHSRDLLQFVTPSDVIFASRDSNGHSQYEYLSEKVDVSMISSELNAEPTAKDIIDLGIA